MKNNYKRLVAIGCSHTYGHGCPDVTCYGDERDNSQAKSVYAWPNVLGRKLGIPEVMNISGGGWSNKAIWHACNNFSFHKDDLVVVLWTYDHRINFITSADPAHPVRRMHMDTKEANIYYKRFFNELDNRHTNFLYIDHVQRQLQDVGCDYYFSQVTCFGWRKAPQWFNIGPDRALSSMTFDQILENYPKGTDSSHTSVEGQYAWANYVYKEIGLKKKKLKDRKKK